MKTVEESAGPRGYGAHRNGYNAHKHAKGRKRHLLVVAGEDTMDLTNQGLRGEGT